MESAIVGNDWSDEVIKLLKKIDNFYEEGSSRHSCVSLVVCGENVGILELKLVEKLRRYSDTFEVICDSGGKPKEVKLNPSLGTYQIRSEAVLKVIEDMKKRDVFETLRFWRNEDYDVAPGPNCPGLFKVERAATSLFGVRAYGSHMNGYIRHPERGICLWLGRRSPTKETFPGMLDNMVAGGLGVGLGIRETMIKECYEEASIPESIANNVVPVGCISYTYENSRGIHMELQYCFDLELPLNFIPKPHDGEVQEFMLYDIDEVKQLIIRDDFKPNCAVVTLHFLIRHGFVTPDNEPRYAEMIKRMHNWC